MKALASLQRDHDINEDEAMRAEELAQEQEKEARTEQLKKTIKDATWEFADEQGMIEHFSRFVAQDYKLLREIAAEAVKVVDDKVVSLDSKFVAFEKSQALTLTTITNNQDAILAQLRNITNDISLAVDTKLKAVEERVQKSFEEFEAKIQGHLTPVANLASCESSSARRNELPPRPTMSKQSSSSETFTHSLRSTLEEKLKEYNEGLFTKINEQVLASIGKSFRMGVLDYGLFGGGTEDENNSDVDNHSRQHGHPEQHFHDDDDDDELSHTSAKPRDESELYLDDSILSTNSQQGIPRPLRQFEKLEQLAGSKHSRPGTANTTTSSLAIRPKKKRASIAPILKWIEVDVGPPAAKKCKIPQKLLESGLPNSVRQDIHKKDQQMGVSHRVANVAANQDRPRLYWLSATHPVKDWDFYASEPRCAGKKSDTFLRHQSDWWAKIWKDTADICPKCMFCKTIDGASIVCFHFINNTTIKMLVETSGEDVEEGNEMIKEGAAEGGVGEDSIVEEEGNDLYSAD